MKFLKFSIIIIFLALIVFLPNFSMAKRAIFPDVSRLQPLPQDVIPNVSGNINYEGEKDQLDKNQNNFSENGSIKNQNNLNLLKSNKIYLWFVVIFVAIFAVAIFIRKVFYGKIR